MTKTLTFGFISNCYRLQPFRRRKRGLLPTLPKFTTVVPQLITYRWVEGHFQFSLLALVKLIQLIRQCLSQTHEHTLAPIITSATDLAIVCLVLYIEQQIDDHARSTMGTGIRGSCTRVTNQKIPRIPCWHDDIVN